MQNSMIKTFAAAAAVISFIIGFAPSFDVQAAPVQSHTVSSAKTEVEFLGRFTASFLNAVRSGTNRLDYDGSLAEAKSSLSELISFYCSMTTPIQFYPRKDSQGTYLKITDASWEVVQEAVENADRAWASYDVYVSEACRTLTLQTTDKDLVDQINAYICRTFSYRVTNAGMPHFLSTKSGQCWHYSKLFADMCNAVGIPAKKVQNAEHAWNEVVVDGISYTFDVTYNDTCGSWTAYSWQPVSGRSDAAGTADAAAVSAAGSSFAAAAVGGSPDGAARSTWTEVNGSWLYTDGQGNLVKSAWVQTNGKWYYLKADGTMMASSWLQCGGKWYYLKADGTMAANTWVDGCFVNGAGVWEFSSMVPASGNTERPWLRTPTGLPAFICRKPTPLSILSTCSSAGFFHAQACRSYALQKKAARSFAGRNPWQESLNTKQ